MSPTSLTRDALDAEHSLENQLTALHAISRHDFEQAEKLIEAKLNNAMDSLQKSASAIQMLLSAQRPEDLETPAGKMLRHDLDALLDSSKHLSRLAILIHANLNTDRQTGEKRTSREIANVVDAVARHRAAVQDNAIALTEAALDKARAPALPNQGIRSTERRPR